MGIFQIFDIFVQYFRLFLGLRPFLQRLMHVLGVAMVQHYEKKIKFLDLYQIFEKN